MDHKIFEECIKKALETEDESFKTIIKISVKIIKDIDKKKQELFSKMESSVLRNESHTPVSGDYANKLLELFVRKSLQLLMLSTELKQSAHYESLSDEFKKIYLELLEITHFNAHVAIVTILDAKLNDDPFALQNKNC